MSELISSRPANFRWQLLATVSALTLMTAINAQANADDDPRPNVWLEFGGLLDHVGEQPDPFLPDFTAIGVGHGLTGPGELQKAPRHAIGGEAAISVQPAGISWDFSVAVRYGRSNANRHSHQQHTVPPAYLPSTVVHLQGKNHNQTVAQTADYGVRARESHTIVDFDAGKDVGIGMRNNPAHIAFGVRFAQFTESSNTKLLGNPDPHFGYKYFPAYHLNVPFYRYYQSYKASAEANRSFQGLGPSLAFTGSLPMAGEDLQRGQLAFDWGVNASLLFGRQKAHIHHQTTGRAYKGSFLGSGPPVSHYTNVTNPDRSRSVVVPNIGALAGLSFNFSNAKVSLGYRADFFFGAMDMGIDTRDTSNVVFHGPYASVSIGLGG